MSMTQNVESAILAQTRRGLRTLLAVPAARAGGLAKVEDLEIPGPAGPLRARYYEARERRGRAAHALLPRRRLRLLRYRHARFHLFVAGQVLARPRALGRLSPGARRRRFPGQIEDVRAACAWAFQNAQRFGAEPGRIAVAGDSAGAYLAATMALEINRATPGAVALQVLLYPLDPRAGFALGRRGAAQLPLPRPRRLPLHRPQPRRGEAALAARRRSLGRAAHHRRRRRRRWIRCAPT